MRRLPVKRFLRSIFALLGSKKGKRVALEMILESYELPGADWQSEAPIILRRGALEERDEISKRARRKRCISVWKQFNQLGTSRQVLIKLGPWASVEDAKSRVASFHRRMVLGIQNIEANVEVEPQLVFSSRDLDQSQVVDYTIHRGKKGNQKFRDVAVNVDEQYFTVSCISDDDEWTWDEVMAIVLLQREKIVTA